MAWQWNWNWTKSRLQEVSNRQKVTYVHVKFHFVSPNPNYHLFSPLKMFPKMFLRMMFIMVGCSSLYILLYYEYRIKNVPKNNVPKNNAPKNNVPR